MNYTNAPPRLKKMVIIDPDFICICNRLINRPCEHCVYYQECYTDPECIQFCIRCDELGKYHEKKQRQAARLLYDQLHSGTTYRYAITFTSPPGRTKADILESLELLKKQKYVVSGTVGYELHDNGAPHLHIALITNKKIIQSNVKRLNHGYNIQSKLNKDVPAKWDNYIKSLTEKKKKNTAQIKKELKYWDNIKSSTF